MPFKELPSAQRVIFTEQQLRLLKQLCGAEAPQLKLFKRMGVEHEYQAARQAYHTRKERGGEDPPR